MNYNFTIAIFLLLTIVIILEPWLLLVSEPVTIYLFNIFACLIFFIILSAAAKEASFKDSEKEIIALTAHQLSSPLSDIKWSLEMMLNEDFGKITEEQRALLAKTREKNDKLLILVNDLLSASNIRNKKYPLNLKYWDIKEIILSVSNFYKDDFEKKKIKLTLTAPQKELPEIKIDGEKIKLVVQNLFDNAIRYSYPGGEIIVSLEKRGKYIKFKIQDFGIGIKKTQRAKIFNKFFRGSNALKQELMGHGLGLFFAKKIITAHGGKIWFKSKENKGTAFYFILPVKKIVA